MKNQNELIPHLFRTEFSRITAVLCKRFGIEHIEVAEDIASETFLSAMEVWTYKGVPDNPVAWLHTVARNKALNHIRRDDVFSEKVVKALGSSLIEEEGDIDLSDKNISDSQLQMLFAICHPSLPAEAQIGLALRILCGFGIDEIATAFLTTKDTINKRLFRAREKLRQEKVKIEFPMGNEINNRLDNVITTLYLLFSEGYYSESNDEVMRKDLCLEAMRLTHLLIDCEQTNVPAVNALFSLMCFHTSRFDARKNDRGELILYADQDESRWNRELISKGAVYLHRASRGETLSKYHVEASISYWHTVKKESLEKWQSILQLYDILLQIEYSPVAALNRVFAYSKIHGRSRAIAEAEKLALDENHYYHTLLGVLYYDVDVSHARQHFYHALQLAKTEPDRKTIQRKIDAIV